MTGFQLICFLQDANGSRLTETKPDKNTPGTWKLANGDPSFNQDILVRLVDLASIARVQNMTREQIFSNGIQKKASLSNMISLLYRNMCIGGQLLKVHYAPVFNQFDLDLKEGSPPEIIEEYVITGFMLFSAMVYCPAPLFDIYNFLQHLLTYEKPRTVIQATVNTIEDQVIKGSEKRKRIFEFYTASDKAFDLQIGKILLATASSSQLEDMLAMELPYFTQYFIYVNLCFNGTGCQGILDHVQTLGKTHSSLAFINTFQVLMKKFKK